MTHSNQAPPRFRWSALALAFAAVFPVLALPAPGQSTVWNPANGHTYFTTAILVSWPEGRALAATYGGYLASINDAAEQAWIQANFGSAGDLWIGLTDEVQNGVFQWESGEPLGYMNWCPGEPNGAANDSYVEIYGSGSSCAGRWNDLGPAQLRALIEIPTSIPGQPVVSAVSPGCGPYSGGTPVTIVGLGFLGATSATIGGFPLQGFVVVNPTRITGITPPGNIGAKDVLVCRPGGCGSRARAFVHQPVPLPPNLAVNGSFETGPAMPPGTNLVLGTGSTAIMGWTVGPAGGDIDLVAAPYWQAADGQRSLDLDGFSQGGMGQVIPTVPGREYTVTWKLAGNPSFPPTKLLRIEAAGQSAVHSFDNAGTSSSNMAWSSRCWTFTATGSSTDLRFLSQTPGSTGPALDDVRVHELHGPLRIAALPEAPVGVPLAWTIETSPPAPFTPYLFEVSFDGSTPGLAVPLPLPGPIPLNPTFLHITYGLAFPQLFSGFIGLLDANGQGMPVLYAPFYAGIVGLDLDAACITFDPLGPLGIGLISNGERTRFVSPAPAVTGVVPATGSSNGGDPVTISGSFFLPGAAVTFGGTPATSVQVVDPSTITCLTPPRPGGPVDIVVSNPGGVPGTLPGAFTYIFANPAPTVGGVNPPDGPVAGNSPVLVTGTGFTAGASVTVGGAPCASVVVLNGTNLVCRTPPGTLGARTVVVTNPDTQAGSLVNGFTYLPDLALSSVAPLVAAAGTPVTLQGVGFQSGLQLTIGPIIVTPTFATPTQIVFPFPSGAACSTQVTVSNPSTQTASLAFNPSPFIAAAPGAVGPAAGGGSFFLIGNNFFAGTTVTVGGAAATIQSLTQTAIFATAPPGIPGNASIVVTSASGCTAFSTYVYQ